MTLEQENDLSALMIIDLKKTNTKSEISVSFWVLNVDAELFLKERYIKNHIQIENDLISITNAGKVYLRWLKNEKEKKFCNPIN